MFLANENRYDTMKYNRCGTSGLMLPAVSLGLWQNFDHKGCYANMEDPVMVEFVRADAGLDIGGTLIGMHLRPVAVPFRGEIDKVGSAHVTCAYSRLPYIGGERAVYQ